jgi:hypothetical protein
MADKWPSNVTHTYEIGSQRGPGYNAQIGSFDGAVNAFLKLGWRIINTYVEGKGQESSREECVCLMGWAGEGRPQYPKGYSS